MRRYRNVSPDWPLTATATLPSGAYDADAAGRLKLELHTERGWIYSGRQSRWADRASWVLEERLPHLFREIEERIAEAEYTAERERIEAEKAAEAARRAAEERKRTWKVLMCQAEERLVESHLGNTFARESDSWHRAETLRRYCAAMDAAWGEDAGLPTGSSGRASTSVSSIL